MTRARSVEPWKSIPISRQGNIAERFRRWLELIRRTLNTAASGETTILNISVDGTITFDVDEVYASGTIELELPDDNAVIKPVTIKNIGDFDITLVTPTSALIEDEIDAILPGGFQNKHSYRLGFDGTNWWII